jgi:hypothetical protein
VFEACYSKHEIDKTEMLIQIVVSEKNDFVIGTITATVKNDV